MPVYAELSANEIVVAPGGEEHLVLTVRNLGDTTESFVVVPLGLCSGWTLIDPPNVVLFAGEEQGLRITLRPPRSANVTAGVTGLTVRVVPYSTPDETATVEAAVRVLAFHERRLSVLQPVLRSRRAAVFDVVVENLGNEQATCRLHLDDESRRVSGRFEPPSVGIEPGMNSSAQVRVRTRRRRWRGGTATLPFRVEATQEGKPSAMAPATLLQTPLLTPQLGARLLGAALALGALAAAWFGLVRPAMEDAAERAVDDRIDEIVDVTLPTPGPDETIVSLPDDGSAPPTSPPETGAPVSFRLAPTTALGETATQEYVVPAGNQLEITDIVLQNPEGDQGAVTLSRNGEVLLAWNLINVLGDDVKQFITPIAAAPGDSVVLTVTCSAVGNPTLAACTPSASFAGRLAAP